MTIVRDASAQGEGGGRLWPILQASADVGIIFALVLLVGGTRLPLRTTMLYNWDSANFALAMQHFDVSKHFPHPPGYFYYVHLAKLFDLVLRDANASLVLVSVLFSVLAVIAVYYLGITMFDRTNGLVAALLVASSVTFWSYGLVALPYVSLAFFSALVATLTYRAVFHRENLLPHLSLAYAIGGGFRPDLLLFLCPLWLLALWRRTWRDAVTAVMIVVTGFIAWFLPTVWLSGGLGGYVATFVAYTSVDVIERYSVMHNGLTALGVNIRDTLSYMLYALYAASPLVLLGCARRFWAKGRLGPTVFLLVWTAPMLIFYSWVHVGDPGYIFTVLPALAIVATRGISAAARILGVLASSLESRARWEHVLVLGIATLVVAANVGIFLFHARPLTLQGIRQTDGRIASKVEYIRRNYAPGSVLLVSYDLYRQLIYYLPEYESLWLDVFGESRREKELSPGVEDMLLVDERLDRLIDGARRVDLPYGHMAALSVRGRAKVVYSGRGIAVE